MAVCTTGAEWASESIGKLKNIEGETLMCAKQRRGVQRFEDVIAFSRSRDAVISVYDDADNVIETHEHIAISRSGEQYTRETKSRHAVKRDGSL
jgi:hypothetical protein